MKEILFVRQNAQAWKQFESYLQKGAKQDPDVLSELFIKLTDDLSYARTFYPKSKTTAYLNELATMAHGRIYKNKREKGNRFAKFWLQDVPIAAYELRRLFLYSLIIFTVSMALGALSMKYEPDFARVVLGDGYVNMTIENIENGDPMGVYKSSSEVAMFLMIAVNNIRVALGAFVLGVFLSVGTGYILFKNGVMLGVFQYFFYQYGLLLTSAMTIWIHGTLEIAAILIAGGAGLALGNSMLFPKTYSRLYSLKKAAMNGAKIMVSLFPVFITAAFLEGFVTRHTEMPIWLSLLIIGSSMAFIVFYYIIYPQIIIRNKIYDRTTT